MAPPARARTVILTCSVAAVTVLGALYGADLKMSREAVQAARKRQEATADETLAQLYASQNVLVAGKTDLETKIAKLENKRKLRDARMVSTVKD
ncbi:MAG: hypothetical protein Q9166_004959 [cf. Caloplaca sp. 2 TL-2023]